jgi:hypothetical protein
MVLPSPTTKEDLSTVLAVIEPGALVEVEHHTLRSLFAPRNPDASLNDIALQAVVRFAEEHNCDFEQDRADAAGLFRKRGPAPEPTP